MQVSKVGVSNVHRNNEDMGIIGDVFDKVKFINIDPTSPESLLREKSSHIVDGTTLHLILVSYLYEVAPMTKLMIRFMKHNNESMCQF